MSEFEKEYQSLRLEIGDYDRLLGHGDVVDKFKDWHSAGDYEILKEKLEYTYSVLSFLVKAHSELWTVTDGRGQLENAIDDAKNILRNRE